MANVASLQVTEPIWGGRRIEKEWIWGVVVGDMIRLFVSSPSGFGASVPPKLSKEKSNPSNIFKVEINFNQELGIKRGFGTFLAFPESLWASVLPSYLNKSCSGSPSLDPRLLSAYDCSGPLDPFQNLSIK